MHDLLGAPRATVICLRCPRWSRPRQQVGFRSIQWPQLRAWSKDAVEPQRQRATRPIAAQPLQPLPVLACVLA